MLLGLFVAAMSAALVCGYGWWCCHAALREALTCTSWAQYREAQRVAREAGIIP